MSHSYLLATSFTRIAVIPTLRHFGILLALSSLTCQWCMNRAGAADWNNPAGGSFTTPSNWQGGVTPGPTDTAYFDLGLPNISPYSVNLGQDWSTGSMAIYNDSVSLNLGGHTLRTTSDFRQSIYVGIFPNDVGYLRVTHGTLTGVGMQVGAWDGSVGHAEVTGADASISLTESIYGELVVGGGGEGYLTISQQSSVTAGQMGVWVGGHPGTGDFGTGTIQLSSGASLQSGGYVYLGAYGGTGHLVVEGGSTLTNPYYGFIGDDADGAGTVRITGEGSQWQTQTVYVGSGGFGPAGDGLLAIDDGGKVSAGLWIETPGTLTGDGGFVVGNVSSRGRIAPGDSQGPGVGELNITGTLQAKLDGALEFDLASAASFDRLQVSGPVTLAGVIDIDLLSGFNPIAGNNFKLMNFPSSIDAGFTFDFSNAPLGGSLYWDSSTFLIDGTIRVVPEPSALVLAALATVGGLFARRRKRNRYPQAGQRGSAQTSRKTFTVEALPKLPPSFHS